MAARKSSGLMLGPTTSIPNLEGLSQAQRIDAMVEWFGQNFEDSSDHTPRDDGEFVYVWGGPHDARDELNNASACTASNDEIVEAIERVEGEAMDWAPSESALLKRMLMMRTWWSGRRRQYLPKPGKRLKRSGAD
jgi:hypothetical protein